MKSFANLYAALDETTKTSAKVAALARYFAVAPAADAAWAVYFLVGRRPRQVVPTRKLAGWAAESAGLSEWLFEECYHAVGDMAETIALILPPPLGSSDLPLHTWVEQRLLPLRGAEEGSAEDGGARGLERVGSPTTLRLEQAHYRQLPRRRLGAARHTGSGGRDGSGSFRGGAPPHGRLGADARVL